MPKDPRGEKRPADAISGAVMIGQIATGEIEGQREEVFVRKTAGERVETIEDTVRRTEVEVGEDRKGDALADRDFPRNRDGSV